MPERKELEIKLAVSNLEVARKVLISHGFVYEDTCLEVDVYYAHPCKDFARTDEAFRFRRRKCSAYSLYVVSYKGPRELSSGGLKVREELEVYVDEPTWANIRVIVEKLGFKPIAEFAKKRELYNVAGMKATVDTLFGVGYFLEIELESKENVAKLASILEDLRKNVAISIVEKTYLEICLETGKCKLELE